jgi:hypothetical protein
MTDEKDRKGESESSAAKSEKANKSKEQGKKSNEITERDRVHDKGYVHRIEEKTEKH